MVPTWNDKPLYVVINIVEEPYKALPTFVNFFKSYAFCRDELNTILNTSGAEYMIKKPNVDEPWDFSLTLLNCLTILFLSTRG